MINQNEENDEVVLKRRGSFMRRLSKFGHKLRCLGSISIWCRLLYRWCARPGPGKLMTLFRPNSFLTNVQ